MRKATLQTVRIQILIVLSLASLMTVVKDIPRRWLYNASCGVLLLLASLWIVSTRKSYIRQKHASYKVSHSMSHPNTPPVTVITIKRIDWNVLQRALNSFRTETNVALEQLSMTLEVVESEEKKQCISTSSSRWKLSDHIRTKMIRLSELYDQDMEVLEHSLLLPFSSIQALPDTANVPSSKLDVIKDVSVSESADVPSMPSAEKKFIWWSEKHSRTFTSKVETYDSIRQVIAHLVRDWSAVEGARIRESIYRWCVKQLQLHHYESMNGPVLVPGAGLGRLAWEISHNFNCAVEAIESSICMTAAAHTILSMKMKNVFVLHPFAADSFSNEIENEARYDAIYFPDVNPFIGAGTLSYTVGNFSFDTMQHCTNQYGAVVTSFFIDTATTVYDFITTIMMVLSNGGLWINVGPLQWHINNQVPVAVNELRLIIEDFRDEISGKQVFQILHWSVDRDPTRYRDDGGRHRSTYYDGYCPLRFVIRKVPIRMD